MTSNRKAGAGTGIWRRRRQDGRRLRAATGAGRRLPRALGAQRSGDLSRDQVSSRLSRRRLHRVSRLVEPRARPQGGYNVVFQPLADGKASGPFVVFADGFAGAYKDPGRAAFRPTGLAEGPDGALYVSDDVHGRIWRITYNGDGSDKVAPAPAPMVAATAPGLAVPPEGMHPDAGRSNPALCQRLRRHGRSSGAGQPDLSWRGELRHLQWVSWVGRRRQHRRARAQFRPLAVE